MTLYEIDQSLLDLIDTESGEIVPVDMSGSTISA